MANDVILFLSVLGVFAGAVIWLEGRRFSAKEIALIGALSALAALGRVPCAAIPGIQPTTFVVMVSGLSFGSGIGLSVGAAAALISNVFLGHGPWTVFQMLAWGLCGAGAGLLGRFWPSPSRLTLSLYGVFCGYFFGFIMNSWYWVAYVNPLTLRSFIGANLASVWFDTLHAGGNAILMFVLGKDLLGLLDRFRQRLSFSYLNEVDPAVDGGVLREEFIQS